MFIAHAPISYLANEVIQKKKIDNLKHSQQIVIAILSLFFGILPDFDYFLMMLIGRPTFNHHDFFTHTPFYWLILWLLLLGLSKLIYPHLKRKTQQFLTKDMLNVILNAFLIAGITHFIADWLVGNIMLFYPLSMRHFTLLPNIFQPNYFAGYFNSVYFAIEILILAIAFKFLSLKFLKKEKWDDYLAHFLLITSVIFLIFTGIINTQTYNKRFPEDSSIPYVDYDTDYDGIRDTQDWDLNNSGIDNITEADYDLVIEYAYNIINSNKLAVEQPNNLWEKILLQYGALNSYRVISQAFLESRAPMEPVLRDFYIKSLDEKRYIVSLDNREVLREFLLSKDDLIELNLDRKHSLPSGKIFFLLDEGEEIMNMGMTLRNNDIAIVLPGERFLQYHTFEGMLQFYQNTISTLQIVQ